MEDRQIGVRELRQNFVPPERPTSALSGRLPEPLELDLNASEELKRLRDEERW